MFPGTPLRIKSNSAVLRAVSGRRDLAAWRGTLRQYAGRLNRDHPDKFEVRIYDYVDAAVPMLAAMYRKRLKGYRAMGYTVRNGERSRSLVGTPSILDTPEAVARLRIPRSQP